MGSFPRVCWPHLRWLFSEKKWRMCSQNKGIKRNVYGIMETSDTTQGRGKGNSQYDKDNSCTSGLLRSQVRARCDIGSIRIDIVEKRKRRNYLMYSSMLKFLLKGLL